MNSLTFHGVLSFTVTLSFNCTPCDASVHSQLGPLVSSASPSTCNPHLLATDPSLQRPGPQTIPFPVSQTAVILHNPERLKAQGGKFFRNDSHLTDKKTHKRPLQIKEQGGKKSSGPGTVQRILLPEACHSACVSIAPCITTLVDVNNFILPLK